MRAALRTYPILGTRTNIPFLVRLIDHPAFQGNRVHTGFLDAHMSELADPGDVPSAAVAAAAMGSPPWSDARGTTGDGGPSADPWTTLTGWGR